MRAQLVRLRLARERARPCLTPHRPLLTRAHRWGRTALMWAACNGHGGCVHALLDVCASESLVDAAGESAVAIAERRAQCGASAGRASVWAAIAAALGGAGTTKRGREMRARA